MAEKLKVLDLKSSIAAIKVEKMTSDEIEQKLTDLLKENIELKEILEQNNAAMKQQFQTLVTWQEQIKSVHEDHKRKFEATKDLVSKLRCENHDLSRKIQILEGNQNKPTPTASTNNSQDTKSTSASQNFSRIFKLFSTSKCNTPATVMTMSVEQAESAIQYEKERSDLEKTVQDLKEEMDRMKLTLRKRPDQITMNPEVLANLMAAENASTPRSMSPSMSWDSSDVLYESNSNTIATTSRSPARKKVTSECVSENVQTMVGFVDLRVNHDDQNQVTYLSQQLANERKKVEILQKKLDIKCKEMKNKDQETCSSIDTQSKQLIKELKLSEEKINNANMYLQKYKDRCCSLENWLSVYQGKLESLRSKDNDTIEQLRKELENVRAMLEEEKKEKLVDKKNLLDAREQFEKLFKDYQELLKTWENFEWEQESKDKQAEAWCEIRQRQMQEKQDRIIAKLVTSEEALVHANQELSKLKTQYEKSQRELESIPILKSQIDVYKSDLEKEKSAKQQQVEVITRLRSELKVLQSQNHQLLNEINAYNETQISLIRSNNNFYPPSTSHTSTVTRRGSNNFQFPVPQEEQVEATSSPSAPPPAQYRSQVPTDNTDTESLFEQEHQSVVEANRNFYYCPKCSVGYAKYGHCVKHVEACLNSSE